MRTAEAIDGVNVEELVALADGTLPDERRPDIEARVARSPRAVDALRSQRRALAAAGAFAAAPPPRLAARVRAEGRPAPMTRRLRPVLIAAGAAAALALAIVVSPSGRRDDTFTRVAAISQLPSVEGPGARSTRAGLLARSYEGVSYPDWAKSQGWRAVGARSDVVDGRASETVFYRHTHHRIGYTVVAGRSLGLPGDARRFKRNGVEVALYHDGPRTVAVFERNGRTCVLAGVVHHEQTLVRLASWKADGALTF